MSLAQYLASLNSSETQWSVYVDPANLDNYRVGQDCFENGGINDGFVGIGSLESLSFGFQSTADAIESLLESGRIHYKGREVRVRSKAILDAYRDGDLDSGFQEFLEAECEEIKQVWAVDAADLKVEEIKEFFAPGGEHDQQCAQEALEAHAWNSRFDAEVA
jgi:hypothetical protein